MAKFVFRLASLLSLKEKLENQKEIEYGNAIKALEEEKRRERALRSRRGECLDEFRQQLETNIDPAHIERFNTFLEDLALRIKAQEAAVKKAEEFAETKRLELIEAMRERKTYDKLKEKDFETFIEEEKRAEQKETDVIVSYRYSK